MTRRSTLVLSFFLLAISVVSAIAQTSDPHVERLVGLARVWNTVKYFHPYLVEKDIDWDKALVDALPRVNAAKTPDEYGAAVNSMLAVLGDKATFARIIEKPIETSGGEAPTPAIDDAVKLIDGVVTVNTITAARIASDRTKVPALNAKLSGMLDQARGIVFDCRTQPGAAVSDSDPIYYYFDDFLKNAIPVVVKGNITGSTGRYRTHNGYVPQSGATSGGYYSSLVTDSPATIAGTAKKQLPIVFLINENTPDESGVLGGLRANGIATVIQDGPADRELGADSIPIKLEGNVTAIIRISQLVNPDGSTGFSADKIVKPGAADQAMAAARDYIADPKPVGNAYATAKTALRNADVDRPYAEMAFPTPEYRLLALFRFWGVVNYFYPYKDLIADTWETVLPRFIPKFEADKDALSYQTTVYELGTELHDSHGFIRGAAVFDADLGLFAPPLTIQYIEDKAVIIKVLDDKLSLKPGDVIDEIDGKPERDLRTRIGQLFAASTEQALRRTARAQLLRGKKDSVARLTVHTGSQKPRTVEVTRSLLRVNPTLSEAYVRKTAEVSILPSGYGYVDLARLGFAGVDDMFKKIMPTKAVIFDMRGYPNGTAWAIAPRLTDKKNVPGALFSRPNVSARELTSGDLGLGTSYSFRQPLPAPEGEAYRGKVVMLIDETAISQAEHTCLFFESATNVTFIGSPTNGANGDVTNLVLPGGIYVNFSGQAVRHADGRQLQRLGIQPTIRVAPTIAGVAAGRDEVLEAAVKYLKGSVK